MIFLMILQVDCSQASEKRQSDARNVKYIETCFNRHVTRHLLRPLCYTENLILTCLLWL